MAADLEQTKKATRDYRALSQTPWTIWDVMYARRSVRKYEPAGADKQLMQSFQEFLDFACEASNAAPDSVRLVSEPGQVKELQKRSVKGMLNKINRWMVNAPLLGFLAISCPLEEIKADRPVRLAKSVLTAQDAVLWLTEHGLGSCWLGAINREEAGSFLGLPRDQVVPLLICVGKPKPKAALTIDNFMYQTVSRRRKPLEAIAFSETMQTHYVLPSLAGVKAKAAAKQDIVSLLRFIYAGEHATTDVPLDLLIDACLEAGRLSPNSSNNQVWRFVVVREEEKLEKLRVACRANRPWKAAIAGTAEAGAMNSLLLDQPFWMIDLPIAFAQMSLAAASLNCLTKLRMDDIDEAAVNRLLDLPRKTRTGGVLGIF
jgi:nitroreductase